MADLRTHRKLKRPVGSPVFNPLVSPITDMDVTGPRTLTGHITQTLGGIRQAAVGARTNVIVQKLKPIRQSAVAGEEAFGTMTTKLSFYKMTMGHEGFVGNWVEAIGGGQQIIGKSISPLFKVVEHKVSSVGVGFTAENYTHGTIASVLKKPTQSAELLDKYMYGTAAQFLFPISQEVRGVDANMYGSVDMLLFHRGGNNVPIMPLFQNVQGKDSPGGQIIQSLSLIRSTGEGHQSPEYGTISMRLKKPFQTVQEVEVFPGTIDDMRLFPVFQHVEGRVDNGIIRMTLPGPISQDAEGWATIRGTMPVVLKKIGQTATGATYGNRGDIAQTLFKPTQDASGYMKPVGTVEQTLFLIQNAFAGTIATEDEFMAWKGAWDSGTSYAEKDIVRGSDDNLYYALQASSDQNPVSQPTYWEFMLAGVNAGGSKDQRIVKNGSGDYSRQWAKQTDQFSDADWANVKVLIGCDGSGTITDFKNARTVTSNGSVSTSSSTKKFTNNSIDLTASGAYLSLANNSDYDATGTGTFEMWVYPTATTGSDNVIFDNRSGSTPGFVWFFNSVGQMCYYDGTVFSGLGAVLTLSQWNHYAFNIEGHHLTMFVNGRTVGEFNFPTTGHGGGSAKIGMRSDATLGLRGYYDQIRITQGVSRYGSFKLPTTAFPTST
ncbi:hypothetical protein GC176_20495 [bacterium]|nr:hypothetical protein [bacterium]